MAWTARLRDATLENGKWNIAIIYSDGTQELVIGYETATVNPERIRAKVRAEVARMNAASAEILSFTPGELIDISTAPPEVPPPPTAEEIARAAWFDDFHKLQSFFKLCNVGLMSVADSRITTLQASLTSTWLNAYLDGI